MGENVAVLFIQHFIIMIVTTGGHCSQNHSRNHLPVPIFPRYSCAHSQEVYHIVSYTITLPKFNVVLLMLYTQRVQGGGWIAPLGQKIEPPSIAEKVKNGPLMQSTDFCKLS